MAGSTCAAALGRRSDRDRTRYRAVGCIETVPAVSIDSVALFPNPRVLSISVMREGVNR